MGHNYQITEYCHHFLESYILEGDVCIDATAGKGKDTEFLRRLVGEAGKVYAFDIQKEAVDATKERMLQKGYVSNVEVIHDSHEKIQSYVKEEVSAILFNLGYLPGGNHAISTSGKTSIQAIKAGMDLLKKDGIISVCIYSGKDSGYEERNEVLSFLKSLDSKKWLVILHQYYNRQNDPPIPAFIIRLH